VARYPCRGPRQRQCGLQACARGGGSSRLSPSSVQHAQPLPIEGKRTGIKFVAALSFLLVHPPRSANIFLQHQHRAQAQQRNIWVTMFGVRPWRLQRRAACRVAPVAAHCLLAALARCSCRIHHTAHPWCRSRVLGPRHRGRCTRVVPPELANYLPSPSRIHASNTRSTLLALHREQDECMCGAAHTQKHQLCPSDTKFLDRFSPSVRGAFAANVRCLIGFCGCNKS